MSSVQRTDGLEDRLPHQRGYDAPSPVATRVVPPVLLHPTPPRPSTHDIAAIQASLAAVQQRPVALAETFYEHLFDIAPAARALFASDMSMQMQRMTDALLATLAALQADPAPTPGHPVGQPGGPPALERSLRTLGALHRDRWDVRPQHYLYIAHALTRAVRDVAGPAWSGSLSSSWIALTQWITGHMLAGHHHDAPTP